MVHILARDRRDEFLSGDCIARFEMCLTDDAPTPTLYIKSNIIDLYFVSISGSISLELINADDQVAYMIGVDEGEEAPFHLFSSVETISEKTALQAVLDGHAFDVILFNDYAIEIARTTGRYQGAPSANSLLENLVPRGPDYHAETLPMLSTAVADYLEKPGCEFSPNIKLSEFTSLARSSVISGLGNMMHIAGFSSATEVHEMLPQIVGDHTLLRFVHSPDVEISVGNRREFSDAIILGDRATLSIQAKGFDFDGEVPPKSRSNAEKRTRKNVMKAIAQTKGSSRMVREGKMLISRDGPLSISNTGLFIFCIFVPSLTLISQGVGAELSELGQKLHEHGQGLVVLDPMQFLRTVQATGAVCDARECTPEDAFFHLLEENSHHALSHGNYTRPIIYRW